MQVIPAILTSERRAAQEMLTRIADSRKFERVQLDFVDGEYAAKKTFCPEDLDLLPYFTLLFDAHLMVSQNNARLWSRMAERTGYDRIIVQLESVSEPENYSGLALDVHSPIDAIKPYLYNLDEVVVMAVEPGMGGQEFVNAAISHVKELAAERRMKNYHYKICVDGGVEMIHLPFLAEWGADEVAVGAERALEW